MSVINIINNAERNFLLFASATRLFPGITIQDNNPMPPDSMKICSKAKIHDHDLPNEHVRVPLRV